MCYFNQKKKKEKKNVKSPKTRSTYPLVLPLKIHSEYLPPLCCAILIFKVDGDYVVPHL